MELISFLFFQCKTAFNVNTCNVISNISQLLPPVRFDHLEIAYCSNLIIVFYPFGTFGQASCIRSCHEDLILTRKSHNCIHSEGILQTLRLMRTWLKGWFTLCSLYHTILLYYFRRLVSTSFATQREAKNSKFHINYIRISFQFITSRDRFDLSGNQLLIWNHRVNLRIREFRNELCASNHIVWTDLDTCSWVSFPAIAVLDEVCQTKVNRRSCKRWWTRCALTFM